MLQQQYNSVTVKSLGKRIGKVSTAASLTLMGLMAQMPAWAAGALEGEVKKQPLNISAIQGNRTTKPLKSKNRLNCEQKGEPSCSPIRLTI